MQQMSPAVWESLKPSLNSPQKVDVWMPRFKYSWESDLNQILSSLGMSVAFSVNDANFTKINSGGHLFISKVKHKTFIEVNEEGTEAAAATSVGISTTVSGPNGPEFHIIRPFLFFITEEDTGAILFAGKVENPLLTN
jgi:serpin B